MRPKHYPWVAMAGALFLFILWSAYRWGDSQRYPDGNLFEHQENERKRKFVESQRAEPLPPSTAESRLSAGGPIFVAALYDPAHVVFMAGADTEPRFGRSKFGPVQFGPENDPPERIAAAQRPAAPLAGLEELWEADSHAHADLSGIVKHTAAGDQWLLQVSAEQTIPVVIERPVIAPTGCTLSVGFLAAVPPDQQESLASSAKEYFVVRRGAAQSSEHPQPLARPYELAGWKPTPGFAAQVKQLLGARMKQELGTIDAQLRASAQNPGDGGSSWVTARARLDLWKQTDASLSRGEGQLDYDTRAFRITPDGVPRVFVRARWQLADETAFLMTAWFRADEKPVLLSADSTWSRALRNGEAGDPSWDGLNFQQILNEFDADRDGWAELLVYTNDGAAARITLDLYTDLGLVPTHTSLQRDTTTVEHCLEHE
jgi:hypothetical protein